MNILLVYPKYPASFWSFSHALKFIFKKAAVPPLGLLTVSAMLPVSWTKKLVDLNVCKLNDSDLEWADYVFISAMVIQSDSVQAIVETCQKQQVKIVAGGPLFTHDYTEFPGIDHFVLNEAEITLPLFLQDIENGKEPEKIYRTDAFADISQTPVPDFHLLNIRDYAFMNIQVTRGCPFACDFCEITSLLGHKVRMKSTSQVLNELETLYNLNWRGPVSIVDDNFIGNKKELKNDLLPALEEWMKSHKYPFTFNTQTSLDLADDEQLLSMMVSSGFISTFIGIETPEEQSLEQCHKVQNSKRNMLSSVRKIQHSGLQVSGGFIVGFDSDTPNVFQRQIDFIQQSGIVSAMVGLLNAPKNTTLYKRLEKENRILSESSGNNTDSSMNFVPKMSMEAISDGYQSIIHHIYSAKPFYKRIRQLFRIYNQPKRLQRKIEYRHFLSFMKTIFIIGIKTKGRSEYWKLLIWTLFKRPRLFMEAVTYSVYGYHFRTVYGLINKK
jgi:radical SAM superfamily enzyme YgiQ (UPF0313 family)